MVGKIFFSSSHNAWCFDSNGAYELTLEEMKTIVAEMEKL